MSLPNVAKLLAIIVHELGVNVTRQGIADELQRYPDPGNLLSISEILSSWNIPNGAYFLTADEIIDNNIPLPFLASFKGNTFALVHEINRSTVSTTSSVTFNRVEMGIDDFNQYYNGNILAFEKDEASGEPDYATKRRKEVIENSRIPSVISIAILILTAFIFKNQSYLNILDVRIGLLTLLMFSGFLISLVLLAQSLDAANPFITRFCGTDSTKNCNAILLSDAAKVFDELSWSEVGFFYFSGSLLSLLFNGNNEYNLQYLAVLNLLCLPYTFYSIYHQWRLAKQWCLFCCCIQAILWAEFIPFSHYIALGTLRLSTNAILNMFIAFALPIIFWVLVKPYLKQNSLISNLKNQLHRFKYNTDLFNAVLLESSKYDLLDAQQSIILGNPSSSRTVTLVSNPTCKHCAKAHQVLEEWLETDEDHKLQVIFSINAGKDSNQFKAARHLLYLERFVGIKVKEALTDWFGQKNKNYDDWSKRYPVVEDVDILDQNIDANNEWCKASNVTHTPMIFINGYKLPSVYQPEDLKYILRN